MECGPSSGVLVLLVSVVLLGKVHSVDNDADVTVVTQFVEEQNAKLMKAYSTYMYAAWDYYTNLTDHNRDIASKHKLENADIQLEAAKMAMRFDLDKIQNKTLKRLITKILNVGINICGNETIIKTIAGLENEMKEIYSLAMWCRTPNDCKPIDPDLTDIISFSRDYEELLAVWKGWRDVSGRHMRQLYLEYTSLQNAAIRTDGRFADMGEYYRSWYESPTFEEDVRNLFTELQPLYNQLHAYVRYKLRDHYGKERFPSSGHIPAHILGNMWAQKWTNIFELLVPYPGHKKKSLTETMKAQGYTVDKMYKLSEEMFTSIGLGPMPESFWVNSMLTEPTDGRKVICHGSAWDMYNGTDFRIKMCTSITEDQFETVQHEMGHLIYDSEYWTQPYLFRDGANPGFHEAVASLIVLSTSAPEYRKRIGLISDLPSGPEQDINVLLRSALDNVAFLPFGYLIDQWRWSLYRGEVTPDNLNSAWWDLRCGYQGISPPVERSETDFDPGAKYHIPGAYPYIRYFVMAVAQFQWHDALCELIGHTGPLNRCSIYGHKTAGKRLRKMLRMGASRPWGEAMKVLTRGTTGETEILSARSILKYYKPLQEWLEAENMRNGEVVGWNKTICPNVRYGAVAMTTTDSGQHINSVGVCHKVPVYFALFILLTLCLINIE